MHITPNVSPEDILNVHVNKIFYFDLSIGAGVTPHELAFFQSHWFFESNNRHLYLLGHRETDANNPVIVKHEQIVMFPLSGFCPPQQASSSGQLSQLSQTRASFTSHTKHEKNVR